MANQSSCRNLFSFVCLWILAAVPVSVPSADTSHVAEQRPYEACWPAFMRAGTLTMWKGWCRCTQNLTGDAGCEQARRAWNGAACGTLPELQALGT